MDYVKIIENKDGSYAITGSAINSLTNNLNNSSINDQITEVSQKVDILSEEYSKYLASKQNIDAFICFGIFFFCGLMIGRLLNGLFNIG